MTRFAESKFSVGAPLTEAYADGYARTFAASLPERDCTECRGAGVLVGDDVKVSCPACEGTGLRAYQK